jgi:hypothetical protein
VATNRHLNPAAVSRIDALLGLPPSDPILGVQQGADLPTAAGFASDGGTNDPVRQGCDEGAGGEPRL